MAKQFYKAIYFSDYPSNDTKDKSVTLAFSEPEVPYYSKVKDMSTQEIKELIGIRTYKQLSLYAGKQERSINQAVKRLIKQNLSEVDQVNGMTKKDVTFVKSKDTPFQRWYPYIEGYSTDFVKSLIENFDIKDTLIYEPFAGTGTTLFASDEANLSTVYSEVNPLLQYLIQTKLTVLKAKEQQRKKLSNDLTDISKSILKNIDKFEEDKALREAYTSLFANSKYFPEETLSQILKLRSYIDLVRLEDELLADTLTIAILSCLLPVSYLKKVGDVRFKTQKEIEKELKTFDEILPQKIADIAEDVINFNYSLKNKHELILSNAKNISRVNELKIGAIITSPPYLNGTNYFRNTKVELWFLRYLQYENDLRFFRDQVLTSGINDVKKEYAYVNGLDISAKSKILKSTLKELNENAYDSRIPIMAKSYFEEMYRIFSDCKTHLENNAKLLIDIGDSIFCGVHIKTDEILIEILTGLGFKLIDNKILRKRRSKNKEILTQSLLVFQYTYKNGKHINDLEPAFWDTNWKEFKTVIPHQQEPFSSRNWGHNNHSLCSYQGKLKPAIAHHLVKTFVPENGSMLDPFSGVGTIPFEAALAGKMSYGIDISLPAYYISQAKVSAPIAEESYNYINALQHFISKNKCTKDELSEAQIFGFNKTLAEYYEENTLKEILLARRFVKENYPKTPSEMLVVASLLHILHGNRPYALSRRSHPIVPYAPTGEFIYKSLIEKLTEKVDRAINEELTLNFKNGKIFNQDTTIIWPQEINNLDAVITSPPFFDSTRFYLANWIRIWFSGWSEKDFKYQPNSFVDERQKKDFAIYGSIFRQSKERLKKDGVCVLHLGKSIKCDMAEELQKISKRWFKTADLFDESVEHCESHGIRDKGTVTSHQYLVLV
ncbi:MAG: DNA methyltransferase [Ignavibacteriaceae bacterium]|jgi:tRNA G10  N-methylase Trm11|nr:DNA methyltransferase [Ignavibacteriaceae bacterium]